MPDGRIITLINGAPHALRPINQDATRRVFTMDKELAEQTFLIHLIGVSASRRKRQVRMLWVATTGVPAVYDGQGSWPKCIHWVKRLSHVDISSNEWIKKRKLFERNQYVILHEVRASFYDLESLGFQRADR